MKVKYYTKQELLEVVKELDDKKKYKVVAQVQHRTIPQNSLLHMYFTMISERLKDLGDDISPELIKEVLKVKLWEKVERKGEYYSKPTKDYTTEEMKKFIDNLQKFSKEVLRHRLPDPEDRVMLDYYDNYV